MSDLDQQIVRMDNQIHLFDIKIAELKRKIEMARVTGATREELDIAKKSLNEMLTDRDHMVAEFLRLRLMNRRTDTPARRVTLK